MGLGVLERAELRGSRNKTAKPAHNRSRPNVGGDREDVRPTAEPIAGR
jgi:hypothetical protein